MSTAEITERDIIEAALEQFRKRGGFTPYAYFETRNGEVIDLDYLTDLKGGQRVVSACAIGGVEHALFGLTGRAVDWNERGRDGLGLAYDGPIRTRQKPLQLYAKTMRLLNRVAREMFPNEVFNVEEVTTLRDDRQIDRRNTIRVFEKALEEAS